MDKLGATVLSTPIAVDSTLNSLSSNVATLDDIDISSIINPLSNSIDISVEPEQNMDALQNSSTPVLVANLTNIQAEF